MKRRKGFTLIELLAVIVILGLLMAIAIPSVTKYITQSRKKTLTNTIGNYIGSLVNEVNDMTYTFTRTNTIYAVPIECIAVERGGTNPFGKWHQANNSYWAYVLVQYDDLTSSYKYGFTFKDSAGYGIYPTTQAKLNEKGSQIVTGLNLSKPTNGLITTLTPLENWTNSGFDVDSTTKLKVLAASSEDQIGDGISTCTLVQKGDNYNEIEKESGTMSNTTSGTIGSTAIIAKAKSESTIIHHNGSNENDANDGSYRYSGADPSNYVCFGTDEEDCSDNLYRIIGVFGDNIKLVKLKSIGSKYWNGNGSQYSGNVVTVGNTKYENYWYYKDATTGIEINATLNEYLNNDFYNSLGTKWQSMIEIHEWNIGGHNQIVSTAKTYYTAENNTKWNGKIGLITPSEFGYAAASSYWTTSLDYYKSAQTTNWLNTENACWTMTGVSNNTVSVSFVYSQSFGVSSMNVYNSLFDVYPSFYLNSSVKILDGGEGTETNPYRLSI